jgi:hypothetical protein
MCMPFFCDQSMCMLNHYNSIKHNQIVNIIVFYLHLQKKCDLKHPPGHEMYRSGTLSMFEVSFVLLHPL